ncbi:MAG: hypothetical protein WCE38_11905 [Burkholderiales bacterium]
MKKLYSLITGVVLVLATPFALAMDTEQGGIEASPTSNAFWYAGTSGVSSD